MYPSFSARAVGLRIPAWEAIELAALAGFRGVDLLIRDLVEMQADRSELRKRMSDLGLAAGAWPLPVDWRDDAETFARDMKRLPELGAVAAELGFRRAGTRVMTETRTLSDSSLHRAAHRRETFELHVERLGAIARVLRQHGSRLGLEVIGVSSFLTGRGDPFLTRLGDLGPLLQALDLENPGVTGVLADSFHLHAASEPPEIALSWGAHRVVWVQIADLPAGFAGDRSQIQDGDRGLPGEHGAVESAALLRKLEQAGYDGPVTPEPLGGCRSLFGKTPEQVARESASALRSVWPETTRVH
jgi:sugar phosphate isomerase/epimerase